MAVVQMEPLMFAFGPETIEGAHSSVRIDVVWESR